MGCEEVSIRFESGNTSHTHTNNVIPLQSQTHVDLDNKRNAEDKLIKYV